MRIAVLCASAILAALMWGACVTSYFVEWSTFTKGPERPRAPGAGSAPTGAATMPVERDETHYMFGHGLLAIHSNTVYTASFQAPSSDLNSWALGWATVDNMFPGLWRFDRYAPGPVMGVKVWLVAVIGTLPLVVMAVLHRRYVPPGHCRKCRYDLRGLSGQKCPECGTMTAPMPEVASIIQTRT
jgi:hypothetical protein